MLTKQAFIPALAGKALSAVTKAPLAVGKAVAKSPGKAFEVGSAGMQVKGDLQSSGATSGRMAESSRPSEAPAPNTTNF